MTLLDLYIYTCGERLEWRPHVKPTSLGVPLCPSCAHPPHVHEMWCKARINTPAAHSSQYLGFKAARDEFVGRLRKYHFSSDITCELERDDCFTRSVVRRALAQIPTVSEPEPAEPSTFVNMHRVSGYAPFWFPITWHPLLGRARLQRVLKYVGPHAEMRRLLY